MPPSIPLFPAPRSLRLLGGQSPLPALDPPCLPDPSLPPGAYSLTFNAAGLTITTSTAPSSQHSALATLAQLRRLFPAPAPAPHLHIADAPAFPIRGVMLDISRTRVPTMAHLLATIDTLASLKFNHLQLYTEHTFAYAGHEDAWRDASPITPSDARALDAHCFSRGIDLAPNQNCFGHLAHWLRLPRYQHLAETHGDWLFDVWPRSGPFSLCPTDPASLDFVRDLLSQLTPYFTSSLLNIGADETYDVGTGRSKAAAEALGGGATGRHALYTRFVSQLAALSRELGKQPMFWADIALTHPESLAHLPQDLIALAWGYEPSSPFDRWCDTLHASGRDRAHIWVCPGTSSWRSITGRTAERTGNLLAASACAGRADGYLACDWGDTGHHQTWPITLHALAHAAQAAWNPAAPFDPAAAATHLFGCAALGPWLQQLGDVDAPLRAIAGRLSRPNQPGDHPLLNQSALFADLHNCATTLPDGSPDRADVGPLHMWQDARDRLTDSRRALAAIAPTIPDPLITAELTHTLDVADLAADRAIARRTTTTSTRSSNSSSTSTSTSTSTSASALASTSPPHLPPHFADRLSTIMSTHASLWPHRSRPGGLDQSLGFYRKLMP